MRCLRLAAAFAASAFALDDDAIRTLLDQRTAQTKKATGIVVGVIDAGGRRVIGSGPAGLDGDSVLEIGSITKAFTGILLAEMAARGEVKLDDPVRKYLPDTVKLPVRNGKEITLESLSTQSSGLPRLPANLKPADPQNPYADYTVDMLYAALAEVKLDREPFERYEYSNLGVGLLGHALALRAGKSYEALLRERILDPLGMRDTAIGLDERLRARLKPGHAPTLAEVKNWDIPTLAGAGALRSTVNDLLKFLAANLEPAKVKGPLGQALAEAQKTHRAGKPASREPELGLGWHMIVLPDRPRIIWHNGGTGGYRSWAGFAPEKKEAAVVLCDTSYPVDDLGRHLLDPQAPLANPAPSAPKREVLVPATVLSKYPGTYEFTPEFSAVITLEEGRLHVQATGQPKVPLFAESETKFFLKAVEASIQFTPDGLVLFQNGQQTPAKRRP